ncbi:DUF2057 domain-containing protein [Vibrio makurazakiensis]|uniref:YccT family protein n=1 Tax=Vibrio makurazakiensis TaxID=2910250 RepID=UPI003D126EF0
MKLIKKVIFVSAMIFPLSAVAAVTVHLDRDVAPVAVNGEEVGFSLSKKDKFVLDNGTNQFVVRVSKLVENMGEREKFNSSPVVITFDEKDTDVYIKPSIELRRTNQADEFQDKPFMAVVDGNEQDIAVKQEILPNLGGITRDYEKELARYNAKNGVALTSSAVIASAPTAKNNEIKSTAGENQDMSSEMIEYWFNQATEDEQVEFTDWAYENRKSLTTELESESKPLEMLSYWYSKADKMQRSQIVAWLVSQ